ncbi:MAG TPA: hypothetical protein VLB09_06570, partial [Nitrospiria bacterium]|nr:hypothetical protein [Nitrospiria bacterium]
GKQLSLGKKVWKEQGMNDDDEIQNEDFELPVIPPMKPGPECPFCGEPTMAVEGDYICLDCNGSSYGPETG